MSENKSKYLQHIVEKIPIQPIADLTKTFYLKLQLSYKKVDFFEVAIIIIFFGAAID